MGKGISRFLVHTAQVETLTGVNGYGEPQYSAPVTVACFTDDTRHRVVSKTGEEVVSETTLYTTTGSGAIFLEGSRVTLPTPLNTADGDPLPPRVSRVIKVQVFDSGPLGLPDHAEVVLE